MDTVSGVNKADSILLFDGVCNLCSGVVRFVIPRDRTGKVKFASLQSEAGQALLRERGLPLAEFNSLVFLDKGKVYLRSSGALRLARKLSGLWPLLSAFLVIPRPLRDWVYDWVARHRFRWFGKKEECWVPSPELQKRFLVF